MIQSIHHSRGDLCLNSTPQYNAYVLKLLEAGIHVLHWCVAAHYFKINFPEEKKWTGKCGFVLLKFPKRVVESAGCHIERMRLPQVASSRRVPKRIVPSFHWWSTYCWRKGDWHSGIHKLLFFFPLGRNKPKQTPKNKIICVCHWVIRLFPCKTNAWQIVLWKAQLC